MSSFQGVSQPALVPRETGSLDSYISSENPISLEGILANIGPNGSHAPGADPGVTVASPFQVNPDCEIFRTSTTVRTNVA